MSLGRTWFKPDPAKNIITSDCRVLNVATRNLFPGNRNPSERQLNVILDRYTKGMTSVQLITYFTDNPTELKPRKVA